MKDLRPLYFHEARERLVGNRLAVYDDLLATGACTGTELAAHMGWPVTSVRPRLCELRELHAVVETGRRRNGEHEFRARTPVEMQQHIAALHAAEDAARAALVETTPATTIQQELFA